MRMDVLARIETELRGRCGADLKGTESPNPARLFVDVDRRALRPAAKALIGLGGRYMVGIGYDEIARNGTLGLIHTFAFDADHVAVVLRTSAPAADPSFESITPDIPSAGWTEREYQDLLGMSFTGHPKPKRLILADDWPAGIYPLRKEVPYNLEPTHRGIEKLCQTQVGYNEVPFVAERICGICGSVHAVCYAQAVEAAAGLKISRRAEYIRTVMLEIERLHSHLLWLGIAGHLIGFDTVFMQAWRVREKVMWLSERITGNRKTYGMVLVGGVRRDITPEIRAEIEGVLASLEKEVLVLKDSIIGDSAIHRRTKGVGSLSREETVRWSLVGPVARARGLRLDTRKDHPYAAYDDMSFDVPVVDTCDVWGTLVVRVLEIFESIKILRQALAKMPADGPLLIEIPEALPPLRHAVSMVEAPRGESVHYVITGEENRPERWRVRAPTYPNLQAVPSMLLNNQFADFPIILGQIDPCFSCTDRVAVIDAKSGAKRVLGRAELESMSRRREGGRE